MLNGVIPVDKPRGMTSHDVVFHMRKILKMKKVGHTGTLDPEVTGVLPICAGEATKLTEYMQTKSKSYHARVTLGYSTDTEDQTGKMLSESDPSHVTEEMIKSVVNSFSGDYCQQVPTYSSVKVGGRKLYEYAREGKPVERPFRTVKIHGIEQTGAIIREDGRIHFDIDVVCSKGTYVRTLARDIGGELGTEAHMSALVRTGSCGIDISQSVSLESLEKHGTGHSVIPIMDVLKDEPVVDIKDESLRFKIRNGQKMLKSDIMERVEYNDIYYVVFTHNGNPLGMYYPHPDKPEVMKPYQMFNI